MQNAHNLFLEAIATFFHADDYNPHLFKETLTNFPNTERNILIKKGFKQALQSNTIKPMDWEGLTNTLVDTQAEVNAKLLAIWNYVYENSLKPE